MNQSPWEQNASYFLITSVNMALGSLFLTALTTCPFEVD